MPAPSRPRLLAALVLVLLAARAATAGPSSEFEGAAATFRREIDNDNPETRLRAFHRMGEVRDARAVDALMDGLAKERARRDAVAQDQSATATGLEGVLTEIDKANAQTPKSPREIDAFNARVRKLEGRRDGLNAKLLELAIQMARETAILGAGVASIATVIDGLTPDEAGKAVESVTAAWMGPKALPEQRVAWVDVLAGVKRVPTGPLLQKAARDEVLDPRARVAAVSARVARKDAGALDDCIALLASPTWPVVAESVEGLRRLHLQGGIEPLIAFLGRDDLGRVRTDAQRALWSLTGQKHGPFKQPWEDWWVQNKATFTMPPAPARYADLLAAEKAGVTFYGITTFSDRILFVLDVSRSMLDLAYPDVGGTRGQERKIDVARRELVAALDMLTEKQKFNIVFFGHRVVPYEATMIQATDAAKDRARRFALSVEPAGGTNIHDVLDTAFRMAHAATADGKTYQPVIDTIFFLTDGTPTAGKLQKPDDIRAAVQAWNRTANIVIHCIAVGDACDVNFLHKLADENYGVFVRR